LCHFAGVFYYGNKHKIISVNHRLDLSVHVLDLFYLEEEEEERFELLV
jgi:hypothetical protein